MVETVLYTPQVSLSMLVMVETVLYTPQVSLSMVVMVETVLYNYTPGITKYGSYGGDCAGPQIV